MADIAEAVAVMAVIVALVWFMAVAATAVRPEPPGDGLRREPPAVVGARVETPHGPGTITAEIRYADGPRWQVRLDNGRHVVLYRAQMVVLRDE